MLWSFFLTIVSNLTFYLSLLKLSGLMFSRKSLFVAMFVTQIVIVSVFFFASDLEFVGNTAVVVIMALLVYNKIRSVPLALAYSVLASVIAMMAGAVASMIAMFTTGVIAMDLRNEIIPTLIFSLVTIVCTYVLSKLTGKFLNSKLNIIPEDLRGRFGKYLVFGLVITLALFYINVFLHRIVGNAIIIETLNTVLLVVYFFFLVSAIYAFFSITQNRLEIAHKQDMLENLKNYTQNIENLYTEMRKLRHDYINMITPLYEFIEHSDIEGVRKYFNDNISPLNEIMQASDNSLDRLKNIKIPELKSIMAMKLIYAQQLKIIVQIDIAEPINNINIDILDLCRIAGILADNAIEECLSSSHAIFKFALVQGDNETYMIFANTVFHALAINKMFDLNYSTKGDGRGLGLYNLQQILGEYDNAVLTTNIENGELIQKITIFNG